MGIFNFDFSIHFPQIDRQTIVSKSDFFLPFFQLWFRVDVRPFRMALLTNIKRWSYAFKKHLTDHVVTSLADLNDFIEKADEGLMTQASGPSLI